MFDRKERKTNVKDGMEQTTKRIRRLFGETQVKEEAIRKRRPRKIRREEQGVSYKIKCQKCDMVYMGETQKRVEGEKTTSGRCKNKKRNKCGV